jgi:predicted MFS family arabinose efflux permease
VTAPAPTADPRNVAAESHTPLVVVLVGVTMVSAIISSLGAPLIPSVARALRVSVDSAQWSLTAALLSGSIAAPVLGRLGDGRRRRETILVSLLVVLLGSILAGVAASLPVLIVGRAMQGLALGLAPITMAAARDHLPADRSPGVIGVLSVAGAAGVGAGYPISGLIAQDFDVHAAFLFGAVISAIALLAAIATIPSSRESGQVDLDVPGAAIAAVGLIALLLAIGEGESWGWGSPAVLALFVAAVVVLSAWVRMQLRSELPFVDLRQLRHAAVRTADLAAMVLGLAMYMFLTVVTQFVQQPASGGYGFGSSTLVAGLCLVPFSVCSLAASRTISRLMRRRSAGAVLVGGSLAIAAAGAFFALAHGALWEAFVMMAVMGVGFGYTFAAIPGLVARAVPRHETGSAMGLYQVVRYVGFSVGSALTASIIAGHTVSGSAAPGEQGYLIALWVGVAACLVSALVSAALSRDVPSRSDARIDRLMTEEAELAGAGLVGREDDAA